MTQTTAAFGYFIAQLRLLAVAWCIGWALDLLPRKARTVEVLSLFGYLSRALGSLA